MKIRYLLLTLLFVLLTGQIYGRQAPTGHAEIWNNVMAYWELWAQRDIEGFLEYHHARYSGWNYDDFMHKNKNSTEKWLSHDFTTKQVIAYDINAIDIKIHENVAVVHYYYSILEKNAQDTEKRRKGRKTDVLIKQEDKWVIVADHGGKVD